MKKNVQKKFFFSRLKENCYVSLSFFRFFFSIFSQNSFKTPNFQMKKDAENENLLHAYEHDEQSSKYSVLKKISFKIIQNFQIFY